MGSCSRFLAAALLAGGLTTTAFAQQQPAVADNNQDEQINLNRSVDESVSDFTVFRTGSKEEYNHFISRVIPLEHADALELLPHALRAVRLERGTARTLKYTDPATGETKFFLQIVTTAEQMPSVVETIQTLDLPGVVSSTGSLLYHMRTKYRRASEVANAVANTTLSAEGSVSADDETNTVFIDDSISDGQRDIVVAQFYDVPTPQVEFDVLAVELEEDDVDKLGLDWDSWKRALGGQFDFTGNQFEGGDTFYRIDGLVTVDAGVLASFLNFTVQSGTGKVVTRTTVTASNNRAGVVSSLKRRPSYGYSTVFQAPSELTENTPGVSAVGENRNGPFSPRPVTIVANTTSLKANTSAGVARPGSSAMDPSWQAGEKSEGIFLAILPVIGTEMVTAEIRLVVNSLAGFTALDEPIISERLMDSMVTLRDGQPFSLGGLDKETSNHTRRGIPLLKDIPIISPLFSVEQEVKSRSKVFVVVTPKFKNQVLFSCPSLTSSNPEFTPVVVVNDDPSLAAPLPEQYQ